jgi:hypothetical protein
MARFYGEIGFGESVEKAPGVYDDVITERKYYGDVVRNSRRQDAGDKVNSDISVGNSISILGDTDAMTNFHNMRYIKWMGVRWLIESFEVQHPRLILQLGGRYNGPTPEPSNPA